MNGFGTYIFPDSSSVEGTWKKNKPLINSNFVEPLGYKWKGLNSDIEKVYFVFLIEFILNFI